MLLSLAVYMHWSMPRWPIIREKHSKYFQYCLKLLILNKTIILCLCNIKRVIYCIIDLQSYGWNCVALDTYYWFKAKKNPARHGTLLTSKLLVLENQALDFHPLSGTNLNDLALLQNWKSDIWLIVSHLQKIK